MTGVPASKTRLSVPSVPTEAPARLQERELERLAGTRTQRANVWLVAATNRDLGAMVEDGSFHRDLYDRLDVFPIPLPPLRERHGDIPHLVGYPAQPPARRMNERIESIPAKTISVLADCARPGNVRELENLVERAVIPSRGPVLEGPAGDLRTPSPPQPYGLQQYPNGYEAEVPVRQGLFVYDLSNHTLTRMAVTNSNAFSDFLYWTFSGHPPAVGGGGDEGGDEHAELPRPAPLSP